MPGLYWANSTWKVCGNFYPKKKHCLNPEFWRKDTNKFLFHKNIQQGGTIYKTSKRVQRVCLSKVMRNMLNSKNMLGFRS